MRAAKVLQDELSSAENVRVRLAEVDAPEKGQAFGNRSRQHLVALCLGKQAVAKPPTDRYGRTVSRVECVSVDANAEQVRAGMAWVLDKHVTNRSLYAAQDEARTGRRGLWSDREPIVPWEWYFNSPLKIGIACWSSRFLRVGRIKSRLCCSVPRHSALPEAGGTNSSFQRHHPRSRAAPSRCKA
jgi:hypothetical protein